MPQPALDLGNDPSGGSTAPKFDWGNPSTWGNGTGSPFDFNGASQNQANDRQNANQQRSLQLWGGAQAYAPDQSQFDATDAGLKDIADSHGLTAGTKSAYQAMQQETGQHAAAQRGAIQQQMVARGMGQSGLDYAAQLQAGQAGADTSAMGGFGAVAQGEQARNQAVGHLADSQSAALEQIYQNYMSLAAGATGQYSQGTNLLQQQKNATQQQQGQALSAGVGLAEAIF